MRWGVGSTAAGMDLVALSLAVRVMGTRSEFSREGVNGLLCVFAASLLDTSQSPRATQLKEAVDKHLGERMSVSVIFASHVFIFYPRTLVLVRGKTTILDNSCWVPRNEVLRHKH